MTSSRHHGARHSGAGAHSHSLATKEPVVLGSVPDEWDYKAGKASTYADVEAFSGTNGSFFLTKLAVDADGAPRAYHPDDIGSFDYLANTSPADLGPLQGPDDPAPGFYVSDTSLCRPGGDPDSPGTYVDASAIPYIVLTNGSYPSQDGKVPKPGCVAFVVDTKTGGSTGAIFADVGHAVGEGSIALACRLGLDPFSHKNPPKVVGFDDKCSSISYSPA